METMKISKIAYPLGLFVCLFIYVAYVKWRWAPQPIFSIAETAAGPWGVHQDHLVVEMDNHAVFYGIMFDAGSTGTRVHIFQFTRVAKENPTLTHETFKALKPGLSAYADDVDKSTQGILELLEVAKKEIPFNLWKGTPLVLKATAGLRLLPEGKAQKLLQKVREVFKASPFFVGDDCVSIMNGTDEGVSAWITVNFLTGSLNSPGKKSVGMLDLGGGSTQITFLPQAEETLQTSQVGYITSFQLFNSTYKLYSYSYLGLGLMSARLAVLGGVEGQAAKEDEELVSPCLSPHFRGEWEHAEVMYRITGQEAGLRHYELCANRVAEILNNKVHKTKEVKTLDFYAFSYYYDLAAQVGLIDQQKGGNLTVEDFEVAAKYICSTIKVHSPESPFLCLDLTYISLLLQELGFPKNKELKLAQKIDEVETSWALGATFHYIDSLSRQQNQIS
ncbi:ectonucleoside triphosphate diphosphohydrolase 6 isoform X1 [Tachyglossus aculeatus]|uniref:ectonucleoside triphosphate diphosphohydrolase 6 isoform X1 n=1 Tax=Tachyglossus aculeatus TaxID=9261 RepID=UPI0018F76C0B|nr:ectonucleoside triphosphate diphosphohydrolase 6 isoform X1 [Tachyglossus aculeatus]XP_038606933.1 ectonucleoside triphosphate diphosphohydrolase 6 isoform X1 [Tachyglossus aculeatus]